MWTATSATLYRKRGVVVMSTRGRDHGELAVAHRALSRREFLRGAAATALALPMVGNLRGLLPTVPKLRRALEARLTADYYLFTNGAAGQLSVVSTVPNQEDYTPAFRLFRVTFARSPRLLTSVEAIRDAQASGRVKIEATTVAFNYPVIKWPGGELSHDTVRTAYLGEGQLLDSPNVGAREVTFKLHQCFPGEWYIVTDTSAAPMAPMMRIAASPRTRALTQAGATAKILVFGNGIKGPGPMGFQPSIFDSSPENPVWSPFWDHFTFT